MDRNTRQGAGEVAHPPGGVCLSIFIKPINQVTERLFHAAACEHVLVLGAGSCKPLFTFAMNAETTQSTPFRHVGRLAQLQGSEMTC